MPRRPDRMEHAGLIAASYAITVLVIAGLVLRAVVDHRAQRRALSELESRGAGRPPDTR